MTREQLIALARETAAAHALDAEIVCAVCEQESSWNPWAIRYEGGFFQRYVIPEWRANRVPSYTEAQARAISWGLMQVMGQTAREHGFTSAHLSELCEPATGLAIGCRVLAHKLAAAEGNVARALLLWNGGGDAAYPDHVLARAEKYRT